VEEIGKILPSLFKLQLSCQEPPVEEVLAPFWTHVVGKALAGQCRPSAFHAGTLTLAIDNADWAAPIEQMAGEIRTEINKFLGKPLVKFVRVASVRKLGHAGAPRWTPAPSPAPTRVRKVRAGGKDRLLAHVTGRPHDKYTGNDKRRVY
jgi:hypothetical protein